MQRTQATDRPENDSPQQEQVQAASNLDESQELIEKNVRDRFKRLCDGYYGNVSKKLIKEHVVSLTRRSLRLLLTHEKRLQDQDQRNHEAYIKSGEIFEDRQQAYEKLAKGHEKLMMSCQA
jgi:regulator of nonsense transcripts 2